MNDDRALKDEFCPKISVQYVKCILCDARSKTRIFTSNVCLINDFATHLNVKSCKSFLLSKFEKLY